MSSQVVWARVTGGPGALLVSPFNIKWRCSEQAGSVEGSKFCLFSMALPARCVSSVSPRFHFRRLAFCFLPLAANLEIPLLCLFEKTHSILLSWVQYVISPRIFISFAFLKKISYIPFSASYQNSILVWLLASFTVCTVLFYLLHAHRFLTVFSYLKSEVQMLCLEYFLLMIEFVA
jgi:hypothetical protein